MRSITIEEMKKQLSTITLIDIRDNYKYIIGKIPTAINIPMNFLLVNPENYLKKNQKYYIYCEYGTRSEKLCNKLSNLGYDVVNVIGGYNEYKLSNHRT